MSIVERLDVLRTFMDSVNGKSLADLNHQLDAVARECEALYFEIFKNADMLPMINDIIKLDSSLKQIRTVAKIEIGKFRDLPFTRDGLDKFEFKNNSSLFAGFVEFCKQAMACTNGYVMENINKVSSDVEKVKFMMFEDPSLEMFFTDLMFIHGEIEKLKFKIDYDYHKFAKNFRFQVQQPGSMLKANILPIQCDEIIEIKDEDIDFEPTTAFSKNDVDLISEHGNNEANVKIFGDIASGNETIDQQLVDLISEHVNNEANEKIFSDIASGNETIDQQIFDIISEHVSNEANDSIISHIAYDNEIIDQQLLMDIEDINYDDVNFQEEQDVLGFNDFTEDVLRESQLTQVFDNKISTVENLTSSEKDFIKSFCTEDSLIEYNGFNPEISTLTTDTNQVIDQVHSLQESFKEFVMENNEIAVPISLPQNAISFGMKEKVKEGIQSLVKASVDFQKFIINSSPSIKDILPDEFIKRNAKTCNSQTYAKKLKGEFDMHVKFYKEQDTIDFAQFYIRLLKKMEKLNISNAKLGVAKVELHEFNGEIFATCYRYDPKNDKFLEIRAENILFFGSKEQCLLLEVIGINMAKSTGFSKNSYKDFGGGKINSECELFCVYLIERSYNDLESLLSSMLPIRNMLAVHLITWAVAKLRGINNVNICVLCRRFFNGYSSGHCCSKEHKLFIDNEEMSDEEFCCSMLAAYKKDNLIENLIEHLSFVQWVLDETFILSHKIFNIGPLYPLTCFGMYPSKVPIFYIPELNKFVSRSSGSSYVGLKILIEDPDAFLMTYISTNEFQKIFNEPK